MATYTKSRVFVAVVSMVVAFANGCPMLILCKNITWVFKAYLNRKEIEIEGINILKYLDV